MLLFLSACQVFQIIVGLHTSNLLLGPVGVSRLASFLFCRFCSSMALCHVFVVHAFRIGFQPAATNNASALLGLFS